MYSEGEGSLLHSEEDLMELWEVGTCIKQDNDAITIPETNYCSLRASDNSVVARAKSCIHILIW